MQKKLYIATILIIACSALSLAQVSVVANKSLKTDKINLSTLKDIYNLDSQSLNGEKVKLFDFSSDNAAKNSFYSALGTTSAEIKKVWLKAKLTGAGNPPENVDSDDAMINKVSSTPGAIGFVKSSSVTGNVKVILELK